MNKIFLCLIVIALVASSGCVLPEVEVVEKAKQSPSVAAFLAEHPNAQLSFQSLSRQQSQQRINEFATKCGPLFAANDYYYVLFSEGANTVEVLVFQKTKTIACIHSSDDLCTYDGACDDQNPCTLDICMGTPKKCIYEPITQCMAGDDCCPFQCTYVLDSDCLVSECVTDADCDDTDASTKDECIIGKPNKCENTPITECLDNDGYCPIDCDSTNDSDCEIAIVIKAFCNWGIFAFIWFSNNAFPLLQFWGKGN